jgi:hypothetical protein
MSLALKIFLLEVALYLSIEIFRSVMAPEYNKVEFSTVKNLIKEEFNER